MAREACAQAYGPKIKRGAQAAAAGESSISCAPNVLSPMLIPKKAEKLSMQDRIMLTKLRLRLDQIMGIPINS